MIQLFSTPIPPDRPKRINPNSLSSFYASAEGRMTADILGQTIVRMWPDLSNQQVCVLGDAPGLEAVSAAAKAVFFVRPHWGEYAQCLKEGGATCFADPDALPFSAESMDRILALHHVEHVDQIKTHLQHVWQILKPRGKLCLIVPKTSNLPLPIRRKPWASTPGLSRDQMTYYLEERQFSVTSIRNALTLPFHLCKPSSHITRLVDRTLSCLVPVFSQVFIIEAEKQIISPSGLLSAQTLVPRPA